jgi:hypothetical protein
VDSWRVDDDEVFSFASKAPVNDDRISTPEVEAGPGAKSADTNEDRLRDGRLAGKPQPSQCFLEERLGEAATISTLVIVPEDRLGVAQRDGFAAES